MTKPSLTDAKARPGALKRIVRNASSILLGNAAGEVLTTWAIVLAAVSLGKEGFGRLSEAQAFMEPFDTLAGFGFGQIMVKVAADRQGCDGTLRGTILGVRLVTTLIATAVAIVSAILTGRGALLSILLLIALAMFATPFGVAASIPYEFEQTMHRRVALPSMVSVVRAATAWLASRLLCTPIGFQLSGMAGGITSTGLGVLFARRHYPARYRFDWTLAKHLLRVSWPAAVLEFVSMVYIRGSYFMLHGHGDAVMGEFAAADRMIRPVLMIGGVFFASALPTVAVMVQRQEYGSLKAAYTKTLARIVVVTTPIVAAVWVLAPWLLHRFAPQYVGSIAPFRALVPSVLFIFVTNLSLIFIIALGYVRMVTAIAAFNCIFFFTMAWLFIPRMGAAGGALATTIMEAINMLLQSSVVVWVLWSRARRMPHS